MNLFAFDCFPLYQNTDMYPIVKKMKEDLHLSPEQADCAFSTLLNEVLKKVPQLEPLMDSIFSDADAENLTHEMDKLMSLLQQLKMKIFIDWTMPEQPRRLQAGRDDIL